MIKKQLLFVSSAIFMLLLTTAVAFGKDGKGGYTGPETCMECHEEEYEGYLKNYHAVKGDPRTPAANEACESCHGPGADHAEEEDIEAILPLGKKSTVPVEKRNAVCLGCHTKGKLSLWHGSEHEDNALSCTDCHSIHKGFYGSLSKPDETEVCTQCHKRVRAELFRKSHHPIREGKIKCGDCHNPHGSVADKLIDAPYTNQKCLECHAETRGPFLWEHPPAVEDCLTCHNPHGSTHEALLTGRVPYLCQRCHSNQGHGGELYARRSDQANQSVYRVLNNKVFYRACLNCHISIHGSNHSSGKTLLR
jgi:DmsE family decaheme c-type cytochrome